LEALKTQGGPKYRAVLVDEAQDFDTSQLEFCVQLLESGDVDDQDLIIVADSAQNIFRKNFRWKDAGIKAQGRTRLLRVNYRNTREILRFAHAFLTADPAISVDEAPDADDELSVIPAESTERTGPKPNLLVVNGIDDEVNAIVTELKRLGASSAPARSVAILTGDQPGERSGRSQAIVRALEAANLAAFWATDPKHKDNKDHVGSALEPIIVSTIHSAKGLEFSKVIVAGLGVGDDPTTARKLLYVGFTRAVDELTVVVDRESPFLYDVQAALD
jgi:superfamily I DNA/RNA helicase